MMSNARGQLIPGTPWMTHLGKVSERNNLVSRLYCGVLSYLEHALW